MGSKVCGAGSSSGSGICRVRTTAFAHTAAATVRAGNTRQARSGPRWARREMAANNRIGGIVADAHGRKQRFCPFLFALLPGLTRDASRATIALSSETRRSRRATLPGPHPAVHRTFVIGSYPEPVRTTVRMELFASFRYGLFFAASPTFFPIILRRLWGRHPSSLRCTSSPGTSVKRSHL